MFRVLFLCCVCMFLGFSALAEHKFPIKHFFLNKSSFSANGFGINVQPEFQQDDDLPNEEHLIGWELEYGFREKWEFFVEGTSRLGEGGSGVGNPEVGFKFNLSILEDQPVSIAIGAAAGLPRISPEFGFDGWSLNQFIVLYIPSGRFGWNFSGKLKMLLPDEEATTSDNEFEAELAMAFTFMHNKFTYLMEGLYDIAADANEFKAGPAVFYRFGDHTGLGLGYFIGSRPTHTVKLSFETHF